MTTDDTHHDRHQRLREDLALHATGDLGPERTHEIDEHLAHCAGCAREFEEIQAVLTRVRDASHDVETPPAKLELFFDERVAPVVAARATSASPRRQWLQVAAVVLAFLAGAVVDRWVFSGPDYPPEVPGALVETADPGRSRVEAAYRASNGASTGLSRGLIALRHMRQE